MGIVDNLDEIGRIIKEAETDWDICPKCGHRIEMGEWPFCPHGKVTGPHPIIMERRA